MIDVPMGPIEGEEFTRDETNTWRLASMQTIVTEPEGFKIGRLPVLVNAVGQTIGIEGVLRTDGLTEPEIADTVSILNNVVVAIASHDPTGVTQKRMNSTTEVLVVLPNDQALIADRPPIDLVRGIGNVVTGIKRDLWRQTEDETKSQFGSIPIVAHEFLVGEIGVRDGVHHDTLDSTTPTLPLVLTQDRATREYGFSTERTAEGRIVVFITPVGHISPTQARERVIVRPQIQEPD